MIASFKTNSNANIFFLFAYALVLKWHSFLYPQIPVAQPTDGFLYAWLLQFLSPAGESAPVMYPFLVLILTLSQAITFNHLINNKKLLPKPNYLPALAYILITSIFPEWWLFSSILIINSLMVMVWAMLSSLFNHPRPKAQVFNAGLIVGVASFFYFPAIGFSVLILSALIILRPFNLSEWLVAILGVITPYYFLFAFLFLADTSNPLTYLPSISFSLPDVQQDIWSLGAMVLLAIPFFVSGFYIQNHMLRMLIQVRKSWGLMLLYLIITLLIPLVNFAPNFQRWILCAVPLAAFHGYTYFSAEKKWLPIVLHWIFVAVALGLNIGTGL